MKYMGSKRAMLGNGLGDLLGSEVPLSRRFVDLFAGSGAVAIHVSSQFEIQVLAYDLQHYSAVLSRAVIGRELGIDWKRIFRSWRVRASRVVRAHHPPPMVKVTIASVLDCRRWCESQRNLPITKAYGGHYFSPVQSVWIDALRLKLPANEPERTVGLAALIQAASKCAAAPGHTAQPFQPTRTAKRYLFEAWSKDILGQTKSVFEALSGQFAKELGQANVEDANLAATKLEKGDLVFIDPPYSGVHYSRFYHVLETIAAGTCGDVSGVGRYPAREFRPRSRYSLRSESGEALDDLLKTVSERGARAILTFPGHDCSNGLSGDSVREIARKYFHVREEHVESNFSTLGGTGNGCGDEGGRSARQGAKELMLVLDPL